MSKYCRFFFAEHGCRALAAAASDARMDSRHCCCACQNASERIQNAKKCREYLNLNSFGNLWCQRYWTSHWWSIGEVLVKWFSNSPPLHKDWIWLDHVTRLVSALAFLNDHLLQLRCSLLWKPVSFWSELMENSLSGTANPLKIQEMQTYPSVVVK